MSAPSRRPSMVVGQFASRRVALAAARENTARGQEWKPVQRGVHQWSIVRVK